MSLVIAGLLVVAVILSGFGLMAGSQVQAWYTQMEAMGAALERQGARARTALSAVSATATSDGSGTLVQVAVDNTGAETIHPPREMDVIVLYTAVDGSTVLRRLVYTPDPPGANEWTLLSLSPDRGNPGMWDPDEQATLELNLVPPAKAGTTGLVVIGTPNGVTDRIHFTP